jgi:hypothetical protein
MRELIPAFGDIDLAIDPADPFFRDRLAGFAHENLVRGACVDMAGAAAIGGDISISLRTRVIGSS